MLFRSETVRVDGITRDYITIKYAGTDKLFVPCDRLEMIGKYIGQKDKDGGVKLSKMGGTEWHRTKARAKAAAKDIAKSLIDLYARRQRMPGFAFPEDCDLEEAFADSFEHEETESQILAIHITDGGVFENDEIKVEFRGNNHIAREAGEPHQSFSFRITAEGKQIVASGDIGSAEEIIDWSKNCDLQLMESGHHHPWEVCEYWRKNDCNI